MLSIAKNDKVFETVVKTVAIFVVNMLFTGKFAAKMLFHNVAMLAVFLAIDCDVFVLVMWLASFLEPVNGGVFGQVNFGETVARAVNSCLCSIGSNVKSGVANLADFIDALSLSSIERSIPLGLATTGAKLAGRVSELELIAAVLTVSESRGSHGELLMTSAIAV